MTATFVAAVAALFDARREIGDRIDGLLAQAAQIDSALAALEPDSPVAPFPRDITRGHTPDMSIPSPPAEAVKAKERRQFTDTQKAEGALLAARIGPAAAARQLGLATSVLARWRRQFPVRGLEGTPAEPYLDNKTGNGSEFDTPPAGPSHPPDGTTTDQAALLVLLDRPEWVDGARRNANGAWVREDGGLWECSCGRAIRTLAQLRSHMGSVVNPEDHHPNIMASRVPSQQADNRLTSVTSVTTARHIPESATGGQQVGNSLVFGCSCQARFPTARDWSDHVKTQPTGNRSKHRLTEQPRAAIVDTGLPRPAGTSRHDIPTVHIIEPHHTSASVVA